MARSQYQSKPAIDAGLMEIITLVDAGYRVADAIRMSGVARRTWYNRLAEARRAVRSRDAELPDTIPMPPQRPAR